MALTKVRGKPPRRRPRRHRQLSGSELALLLQKLDAAKSPEQKKGGGVSLCAGFMAILALTRMPNRLSRCGIVYRNSAAKSTLQLSVFSFECSAAKGSPLLHMSLASLSQQPPAPTVLEPAPPARRLLSLDALRGFDM